MNSGRLPTILDRLDQNLREPVRLRIIIGVVMIGAWYALIYTPINDRIELTARDRARTEAHLDSARAIDALRIEVAKFQGYLPPRSDTNEWVEYVLGGVRKLPIKVLKLEPQAVRKHGPFEVVVLKMELQGAFADIDALLAWIEVNPRLLRIDAIVLEPGRAEGEGLTLRLTVLGVLG
jgi:hypothetical protein